VPAFHYSPLRYEPDRLTERHSPAGDPDLGLLALEHQRCYAEGPNPLDLTPSRSEAHFGALRRGRFPVATL
jgi:hypothetical protein